MRILPVSRVLPASRAPMALAALLLAACSTGSGSSGSDSTAGATARPTVHGDVASATTLATGDSVTVYKDPSCGCCKSWVKYMRDSGFAVRTVDMPSSDALDSLKGANHVPQNAVSCHTALVNGYVVEGHVPADLVHKMLREHPDIVGLSVPGMVTGSPGMEGPDPQHYTVMAIGRDGSMTPYASR